MQGLDLRSDPYQMLLKLLIFLLPLYSIRFNLGIEIALYKVLPILLLPLVFLGRGVRLKSRLNRANFITLALIVYMVSVTVWRYLSETNSSLMDSSVKQIGQDPLIYMVTQTLFWLIPIFSIFIFQSYKIYQAKALIYFKYFSYGLIFSCFVGFFLLGAKTFFGAGLAGSYEAALGRLGGLSGEPRHLGSFIVLVLFFTAVKWSDNRPIINLKAHWCVFLLVALFLTSSSSAIGGASALVALMAMHRFGSLSFTKSNLRLAVSVAALVVILLAYSGFLSDLNYRLSSFSSALYHLPKDSGIILLLLSNFSYLLFGCGAGGVDMLLASNLGVLPDFLARAPIYSETGIEINHVVASGGIIRFVSDFGLVGVALLTSLIFSVVNSLKINKQGKMDLKMLFFCFSFLSTMSFVVFLYGIFLLSCTASGDKSYTSFDSKP